MEQIKIPSQEPYKQDITDYLNLLFGKTEESKVYWREGIKVEITASFGENSLFPEETSKGIYLFTHLSQEYPLNQGFETENLLSLLHRVQHLAGVKISTRYVSPPIYITCSALQQFSKANDACFVYPDITKISAKVKDMNITAHAEGMSLYMESMQRKGEWELFFLCSWGVDAEYFVGEEGDRLFYLAMRRFEAALSSTLDNHVTVKSWGDALLHQVPNQYLKTSNQSGHS